LPKLHGKTDQPLTSSSLRSHRSTHKRKPSGRDDEARRYVRYIYRRIATLLRKAGWFVNDKRVERIWPRKAVRPAGLKVASKQSKR